MIKRMLGITLKNSESIETWPVGGTGADVLKAEDIGKALALDTSVAEGAMKLAGADDEIAGFVTSLEVEQPTHNGRVVGSVLRPGQGARQYVTSAAALVVGDYIVGAAQPAAGVAGTLYNFAGSNNFNAVNGNITVVGKAAAATPWRVISVADATNKIYLVEAV